MNKKKNLTKTHSIIQVHCPFKFFHACACNATNWPLDYSMKIYCLGWEQKLGARLATGANDHTARVWKITEAVSPLAKIIRKKKKEKKKKLKNQLTSEIDLKMDLKHEYQ